MIKHSKEVHSAVYVYDKQVESNRREHTIRTQNEDYSQRNADCKNFLEALLDEKDYWRGREESDRWP